MQLNEMHRECLSSALAGLLKGSSEGTMVFTRCLSRDLIEQLWLEDPFRVSGWQVYAVTEDRSREGFITADQAVDLRELKQDCVLLLVDAESAGAGMDGIYSASREISEKELLQEAVREAKGKLTKDIQKFAESAVKLANQMGGRRSRVTPWQEFDFYAHCAMEPEKIGKWTALLGLWCIDTTAGLEIADLETAARLTERLLLPFGGADSVSARVSSILLKERSNEKRSELETFLREHEGNPWRSTAHKLMEHPSIWLHQIEPGFDSQTLDSIELIPWRAKGGRLLSWSGLVQREGEDKPAFLLDPEALEEGLKSGAKLQVRWQTKPKELPPGAAVYRVSVVTGSDEELAVKEVTHGKSVTQHCTFTQQDFEDLDTGGKWEVFVRVHPVGEASPDAEDETPRWRKSEEFILTYESFSVPVSSSAGRQSRALVDEAIKHSKDEFDRLCKEAKTMEDNRGFLYRSLPDSRVRTGRVFRPALIREVEETWKKQGYALGRWSLCVRDDGSAAEPLQFHPLSSTVETENLWTRLGEDTRLLAQKVVPYGGFMGVIHYDEVATDYINAWASALEAGDPQLALAHTLEIKSLSGKTYGLIVLPSHPLLVAWHQAYDRLAIYLRYDDKLRHAEAVKTLSLLDGSYFPAFLPGVEQGRSYVFGDMLGFYAVAMLCDDDKEPQASLAVLSRCLAKDRSDLEGVAGKTTAEAIAREIDKYITVHPEYPTLCVNALRPGDGFTVAQSLGISLKKFLDRDFGSASDDSEAEATSSLLNGYILNLYPSSRAASIFTGKYLSETAERRRAGSGLKNEDRWMLETYEASGLSLPRLKWSKRIPEPDEEDNTDRTVTAHISLAFDTFDSSMQKEDESILSDTVPLESYGLSPSLCRSFKFDPVPTWMTYIAPKVEGDKHPVNRMFTDRLLRVHRAIMRLTATNLHGEAGSWPVLKTVISPEKAESIELLHERSDWVVTIDRNAGIEYFDMLGRRLKSTKPM